MRCQELPSGCRWPLDPIGPDEELTLLLRPRGASAGEFAVITLKGAGKAEQQAAEALVARLSVDAAAWLKTVDAMQDPRSEELDALRREVLSRGCGGSGLACWLFIKAKAVIF